MKRLQIIIILFLSILIFSCKEESKENQLSEKDENLEPQVNTKELESDFIKWWTYYSNNINLSSKFVGLNEESEEIDKKQFLYQLSSGNFIPLTLEPKDGINLYKLHKLDSLANKGIASTIKSESFTELKHFNMEGTDFPKFDFIDLNDNHYTNENTKGKIIVFKTWFINCQACIAEFPELNELVEKYKNRNDIIFVSIAIDSKLKLEEFLQKKHFEYAVVSNQREYIEQTLNLQNYPTHIIVDNSGKIQKVANKATEIISFLENEKS